MSVIYDKYKKMKEKDKEKMYLFRSGNFYIFLGEDADNINNYVVLKKTPFCKETIKCGFPIGSLDDYMKVFHNQGLNVEVVEDSINATNKDLTEMISILNKLDLNQVTPLKALNILKELKDLI